MTCFTAVSLPELTFTMYIPGLRFVIENTSVWLALLLVICFIDFFWVLKYLINTFGTHETLAVLGSKQFFFRRCKPWIFLRWFSGIFTWRPAWKRRCIKKSEEINASFDYYLACESAPELERADGCFQQFLVVANYITLVIFQR